MSDTPRTDAAFRSAIREANDSAEPLNEMVGFSMKLERELNAANKRIKRLEEALGCVVVGCNHLHHRKKHQHRSGEPCPVEELIRKAKEANL